MMHGFKSEYDSWGAGWLSHKTCGLPWPYKGRGAQAHRANAVVLLLGCQAAAQGLLLALPATDRCKSLYITSAAP